MSYYWYAYLVGVALMLAAVVSLRRMKLEEEETSPPWPWWGYLIALCVAAAWPLLLALCLFLTVLGA